jgi:hypothetical protein
VGGPQLGNNSYGRKCTVSSPEGGESSRTHGPRSGEPQLLKSDFLMLDFGTHSAIPVPLKTSHSLGPRPEYMQTIR